MGSFAQKHIFCSLRVNSQESEGLEASGLRMEGRIWVRLCFSERMEDRSWVCLCFSAMFRPICNVELLVRFRTACCKLGSGYKGAQTRIILRLRVLVLNFDAGS
jgi:hypothetical protein